MKHYNLPTLEIVDSDPEPLVTNKLRVWTDGSKYSNLKLSEHHDRLTLCLSIEDVNDEDNFMGLFLTLEEAIALKNYINAYVELAKLEEVK